MTSFYLEYPWWHADYSLYRRGNDYYSNYKRKSYSINEKEDEITVEVEVPGYSVKDLSIIFENKILDVMCENDKKGKMRLNINLEYPGLSVENSKASLNDGILLVSFKKESLKSSRIEIE